MSCHQGLDRKASIANSYSGLRHQLMVGSEARLLYGCRREAMSAKLEVYRAFCPLREDLSVVTLHLGFIDSYIERILPDFVSQPGLSYLVFRRGRR